MASTNLKRVSRLCHSPPTSERTRRVWRIVNTAPLIQPYNYRSQAYATGVVQSSTEATVRKRSENKHGDFLVEKKIAKQAGNGIVHSSRLQTQGLRESKGRIGRGVSQRVLRTDVFYRSVEAIRVCEPGGQLADNSTTDEHLRRGRSSLRNMVGARVFPLSCCRARRVQRSAAGCCRRSYPGPEGCSPEGCSSRDTPLPGLAFLPQNRTESRTDDSLPEAGT